ncbi:MAG TPA: stage II sporulation protein D [Clostridiales bacterium]|nr:stage II sporulation protein D [Clostridiales bacterium]
MKWLINVVLVMVIMIIIFPMVIIRSCGVPVEDEVLSNKPVERFQAEDEQRDFEVDLYIKSQNRLQRLPLEEYVIGVVAAEMPAAFEMEALKAQAVVARTYVVNRLLRLDKTGCSEYPSAHVCDQSDHCQGWIDQRAMEDKWGKINYYKYIRKISAAVEKTGGQIIVYDNSPIEAVFHSTSGGKTENSEDVWNKALPYLRSVVSDGEEKAPKFTDTKTFSVSDFISILERRFPSIKVDGKNLKDSIRLGEITEGGRVKDLTIGDVTLTGNEFRQLYDLNSANFKIKVTGNQVVITTIGYGHGVGMSQYGANGMAEKGSSYREILRHYYKDTDIIHLNELYSAR